MSHHRKTGESARKRAQGRLQKMCGSLKGRPSLLEFLLKERRRDEAAARRLPQKKGGCRK